jgi:hypothetical protein
MMVLMFRQSSGLYDFLAITGESSERVDMPAAMPEAFSRDLLEIVLFIGLA